MQGSPIFETLAIEHLLKGLTDQKLAYEILTKRPRDLAEAIDMINWHEACRQYTVKPSGIRNLYQHMNENECESEDEDLISDLRRVNGRKTVTEERISQLWREMQNYITQQFEKIVKVGTEETSEKREKSKSEYKPRKEIVCFRCNERGHIAPHCPVKSTPEKNSTDQQRSQENEQGLY
jgi:hypothetical protein